MPPERWTTLTTLVHQAGAWRAFQLGLLKLLRKCLSPSVNFYHGMTAEDIVLLFLTDKYLKKKRIVYVDVGCHEPRRISNTYLFYLSGGSGLAIDLDSRYADQFRRERPRDIFVCAAVSDVAGETTVHEFAVSEVNTINQAQAQRWHGAFEPRGLRKVQTVRLASLIAQHMPNRPVDVLLLDVEGQELAVLQGAELSELRPGLIVCELHDFELWQSGGNPLVDFLSTEGYRLVGFATINAYFVRADLLDNR